MNPLAVGTAVGGVLLMSVTVLFAGGLQDDAAGEAPAGGCVAPLGNDAASGQQAELDAQQMGIARTIAGVGKGMHVSERGVAIALATAMQESTLDPTATSPGGRSVGLFQQQGSLYSDVDRADPADSSRAFYAMLKTRVPEYNAPHVPIHQAAQTVQASGAGAEWYAQWEQWSTDIAGALYHGTDQGETDDDAAGLTCTPGGSSPGDVPVDLNGTTVTLPSHDLRVQAPNAQAARAIAAGLAYLGTEYVWGGGDPTGPTQGIRDGGVADAHGDYAKTGFDCAGLTQYAYAQADTSVTRPASAQLTSAPVGQVHDWEQAQPGDLLFWGASPHHVAIYLGEHDGQPLMVEAPQSGEVVEISPVRTGESDFQHQVVRPA